MSFWDKVKNFTQPYSDDEYDEYDEEETTETVEEPQEPVRPRRRPGFGFAAADPDPEPETTSGSSASSASAASASSNGFTGHVVGGAGTKQEVVLFHPVSFNDTSKAADHLRARKAVIVNMENVDKAMARRVVDFLSGCVYALDGDVKKIAQSAYLFCPHNMEILGDLDAIHIEQENYV